MIYATKIRMNYGCYGSYNCIDINSVYLVGEGFDGFQPKSAVYDYLKVNPNSIRVNHRDKPYLVPVMSVNLEKYVRSEPNNTQSDNLLALPRE